MVEVLGVSKLRRKAILAVLESLASSDVQLEHCVDIDRIYHRAVLFANLLLEKGKGHVRLGAEGVLVTVDLVLIIGLAGMGVGKLGILGTELLVQLL